MAQVNYLNMLLWIRLKDHKYLWLIWLLVICWICIICWMLLDVGDMLDLHYMVDVGDIYKSTYKLVVLLCKPALLESIYMIVYDKLLVTSSVTSCCIGLLRHKLC